MARGGPPKAAPSVLGLPPTSFKKLYTFHDTKDVASVVVGCLVAAASGSILPLFSLIFGAALNVLNDPTADIVAEVSRLALYFLLIAIGAGFLTFTEVVLTTRATERALNRLRKRYAERLLTLDAAWYDTHRAGECVTRLSEATITMATGLDKLPSIIRYTATLVCGFAIGFSTSWKLTMVIFAVAPIFALSLGFLIVSAIRGEKSERTAYARAGDAATEVFSLIRSVGAYGGEAHELRRFSRFLASAQKAGIMKG